MEILFVVPGCGKLLVSQPVEFFTFKLKRGYVCLWSQGVSLFVCEARV